METASPAPRLASIRNWGNATEHRMIVTNAHSVYIGGPNDGDDMLHPTRDLPWPARLDLPARNGGHHTYKLDVAATTMQRAVYRYAGHRPVHQ